MSFAPSPIHHHKWVGFQPSKNGWFIIAIPTLLKLSGNLHGLVSVTLKLPFFGTKDQLQDGRQRTCEDFFGLWESFLALNRVRSHEVIFSSVMFC